MARGDLSETVSPGDNPSAEVGHGGQGGDAEVEGGGQLRGLRGLSGHLGHPLGGLRQEVVEAREEGEGLGHRLGEQQVRDLQVRL